MGHPVEGRVWSQPYHTPRRHGGIWEATAGAPLSPPFFFLSNPPNFKTLLEVMASREPSLNPQAGPGGPLELPHPGEFTHPSSQKRVSAWRVS